MWSMQIHPLPTADVQVGAALLVIVGSVVLIGAGWLWSSLSARLRRLVSGVFVAVIVSVTVVPRWRTQIIIDGLECCDWWFELLWICISKWNSWC